MYEFKQTFIENNSIRYHEMHTENQEVKSFVLEWVVEVEAPTVRKVKEAHVTILFYHYEINIFSIFNLK